LPKKNTLWCLVKIFSEYMLETSSSIQKAMKKLLEKDLIQQKNSSYVVVDLFFYL